ncbi:reticulophagy regulator 1 isoform X2 [Astyanax mexicanus]|uniref:Reticulophagy regulator 1 isoform X1 n=1 Tax=Astyanax mexicanus TaxID=7994 RepID=A0A8T2LQ44_ASTMX|nr:reticulophagy regulator 1 isoform X2 [Astyanax mexicanus]KAG9273983.1 reticulophagy regulator 1 isoform X1 [Astyanax mexicanus]
MAGAAQPVQESGSPGAALAAAGSGQRAGGCRVQELVDWGRPFRTSALFAATNALFWFVSLSPCRVVCLLCLCLALLMMVQLLRDMMLSRSRAGACLWRSMTGSWEMVDSGPEGRSGAEAQFTVSWMSFKLFLAETSSFKQQNPGKFCLLVCSLCSFLAVLGRYIPGIVISYIIVLGIFLWPLVSSHEFGMWLDPVLQKLDFGVADFLQKIKENHEKRLLQAQAEKESIEADLSSLFPKLDSTVCREMSVSDTEVSEVTWTDNGTFNLSEGHTPQTENSEDLDRRSEEEAFSGGLPDFPSLDNGLGTNGEDDDDLSIGVPTPLLQPSHPREAQVEGEAAVQALGLVQRMAGDVITAAVAAAMQERLEAVAAPVLAQALAEDTDSEAEDFELLDQSELEQLEGELGLEKASGEAQPREAKQPGFFSKLLGNR